MAHHTKGSGQKNENVSLNESLKLYFWQIKKKKPDAFM